MHRQRRPILGSPGGRSAASAMPLQPASLLCTGEARHSSRAMPECADYRPRRTPPARAPRSEANRRGAGAGACSIARTRDIQASSSETCPCAPSTRLIAPHGPANSRIGQRPRILPYRCSQRQGRDISNASARASPSTSSVSSWTTDPWLTCNLTQRSRCVLHRIFEGTIDMPQNPRSRASSRTKPGATLSTEYTA